MEWTVTPTDLGLAVLYEDEACLVVDKIAGIAVHPGAGTGDTPTILSGVAHLFGECGIAFDASSVLAHRLDKDTTGCLLVAKTPKAHAALQKQFAERETRKTYLAVVAGIPTPPQAMIDAPVGRNLTARTRMSVLKTSTSRDAKTTYRTLDTGDDLALLVCEPHTGRTHQIRVHLRSVGHPILGDATYGTAQSQAASDRYGIEGLRLHAWKLQFTSPADEGTSNNLVEVTSPLPKDFFAKTNLQLSQSQP